MTAPLQILLNFLASALLVLPLLAHPNAGLGRPDREALELRIGNAADPNPMDVVKAVWALEDMDLINKCIWSGNPRLETAIKIQFGNTDASAFRDTVAALILKAPGNFWGDKPTPPRSMTGTIDFAMRRSVLDALWSRLGRSAAEPDSLLDETTREVLANRLESSLEIKPQKAQPNNLMDSVATPPPSNSTNEKPRVQKIKRDDKGVSFFTAFLLGSAILGAVAASYWIHRRRANAGNKARRPSS